MVIISFQHVNIYCLKEDDRDGHKF